jgi:pilus assembly protein CpaD
MMQRKSLLISVALGSLVWVSGCQSNDAPQHLTAEMYHGTLLDRHQIGVTQHTEYIEVKLDARDTQLRISEIMKVRDFLRAYVDVGHGPLVISMPQSAENPQLAVGAVAEIREFAWEAGIGYEAMLGAAYDASERNETPIVMAYKSYKAVAPKCRSLADIDMSDATSNTDLPTLGCAVRTNMAAMIAEPADLLGERELSEGDLLRRSMQLDLWRQGQPTPAARGESESTAISTAVQ